MYYLSTTLHQRARILHAHAKSKDERIMPLICLVNPYINSLNSATNYIDMLRVLVMIFAVA